MKKSIVTLAVSTVVLGMSSQVSAAGFQLAEYSATGLGRAFAGDAAMADNASSQSSNPAMLSYLKGAQFSGGGVYVMPDVDVVGDISVESPLLPDAMIMNADAIDVADNAFVPNFYYSNQLNDQWTWGVAFNSNYGLATEIPEDHTAAIFGNHTSITTVEFNPNVAYRINEQFSVGAGLRVVYGDGEIGASTPAWVGGLKAMPGVPDDVKAALPDGGTSLKYMKGDDIAFGWKFGGSWQLDDTNRLAFAYHSGVKLELDGYASGLVYEGEYQKPKIDGYIPLELPAFAELASYHQLTDNWAIHGSVNWTQWSVFKELVAYFPDETPNKDVVKVENFHDNWRFALGTTYDINSQWLVRAGVALDKTAVDDQDRTTTIPDADRLWFSVGASYQATKNLSVDVGVTYIHMNGDAPITESQNLNGLAKVNFSGEAQGSVLLTGIQLSYKL
ncbi:outer membrane protein transport protein [Shewanella intestini]|uniref:Aromatic hydrocarbon degradation protein n=1 Tax=Shewanella intestini TaxID=2017544 RepID=A0ABS5I4V5_9GAMM|nr:MULTISPECIES: outer membrane protein transport protein [Shewanella]MBR9729058.1 aromatic hydrocarbon degradation protein [Shewanella intestini]MRG37134.1 aromatic hydrocarbon degradation protein [Shewanella sp. XMDDZSB0408]